MHKIEDIKKYPYLSYSHNLIEYFIIIGYDTATINNDIIPEIWALPRESSIGRTSFLNPPLNLESTLFSQHSYAQNPTVLSSISSDFNQSMLDLDIIINLVFPCSPTIYYTTMTNNQYEPNRYSVIFFFNSDPMESNKKSPFHSYSLIFYECFNISSNTKVFIPKAFTLISQYPLFSFYNYLTKEILRLFKSEIEIPIEIIIYNIINFVPSPLNYPLLWNWFPERELSTYSKDVKKNNKDYLYQGDLSNSHHWIVEDLSGYPILNFNWSELFNFLPWETILQIWIFSILEKDMIFFSRNWEVWNLVMYIFASFSYPYNDSIYLWQILSVSIDEVNSESGKFFDKPCTSMIGINCTYSEKINLCDKLKSHFVVDWDNQKFLFLYDSKTYSHDQQEIDGTLKWMSYLDKILSGKKVPSAFLEKHIIQLVDELMLIIKKIIHINYRYKTEEIPIFFSTEGTSFTLNKSIQEKFYDFITNILSVFYSNFDLHSYEKEGKKIWDIKVNFELSGFSTEEGIFFKFWSTSNMLQKYKDFIKTFNAIDWSLIPLMFSEEFISMKNIEGDICTRDTHFFEILDDFYMKKKKEETEVIHFHQFYSYYYSNLRNYISNQATNWRNVKVSGTKNVHKKKKIFKYNSIDINLDILFKYVQHLSNLPKCKLSQIFPMILIKERNTIKMVSPREVPNTIEKCLIKFKTIKAEDLLNYSWIMLVALISQIIKRPFETTALILERVKKNNYFMRKYLTILVNAYYRNAEKYHNIASDDSNTKADIKEALSLEKEYNKSYNLILNFLIEKK